MTSLQVMMAPGCRHYDVTASRDGTRLPYPAAVTMTSLQVVTAPGCRQKGYRAGKSCTSTKGVLVIA
ncbi:hypothetical protein ACOMHN_048269 [Nucella lapillus]